MVAKLMKHELRAIVRIVVWIALACLIMAVIARIGLEVNGDGFLGIFFAVMSIWVAMLLVFVAYLYSVAQFSRSFYTGEGYLTFSLPVTPTKFLIAKLLSAIVAMIGCIIVSLVAFVIVFMGLPEIWEQLSYVFGMIGEEMSIYYSSDPMLAVELALIVITAVPTALLLFYLVVSVGQLFTKSRKLITIAIFFGFFFVVVPLFTNYCFDPILQAANIVSPHLGNWIQIVFNVGVDVGAFFLVRYILIHKVNLIA